MKTTKISTGIIIGITGLAGSGKDTAAVELISTSGVYQYAFARPMKEAAKLLMGWTDEHVHGKLKDVIDPLYGVSPRYVLQTLGTEWGRSIIHKGLWTLRAERFIESCRKLNADCNIVITDVRFDNEAAFIKEAGGIVLEVIRPDRYAQLDTGMAGAAEHTSEGGVHDKYISARICNDGTVEELHQLVGSVLAQLGVHL